MTEDEQTTLRLLGADQKIICSICGIIKFKFLPGICESCYELEMKQIESGLRLAQIPDPNHPGKTLIVEQ